MKLIICILQDSDKDNVTSALTDAGFRVTIFPSTGGFFRRGNATIMVGVEDDKLPEVTNLIKDNLGDPAEPNLKRATLFAIEVAEYTQV